MRIVLTRAYAVAVFILIALSGSKWQSIAPALSAALFLLALLLVAVAAIGRLWCSLYIGGHKNKRLIVEGPYSVSRNPLYLFSLVGILGVGLATMTFSISALLVISFFLYYPSVIKKEEANLERLFPAEFLVYEKSVPCLIPRSFHLSEPAVYEVNPRIFRNHMFSAIWFVPLVGALAVVGEMHRREIWPVLWTLY